jgi:hypothetical protein
MRPIQTDLLRKLGILISVIILALTAVSCGSDDPVAPAGDDPPANGAPEAPTINTSLGTPSDGATNVPLSTTLHWLCSDPDGDALSYDIHVANTNPPPVTETALAVTNYGPMAMVGGTTFYWQVVATDPDGETTASPVWSFTTLDTSVETISNPANPAGLATPTIGVQSTYTTTSATSSEGHAVEYQFNWADGTTSDWATATSANHTWTSGGTFNVTAQARCAEHNTILSALSGEFAVTVVGPEAVSTPNPADGPLSGETGELLAYNLSGAVSSLGHNVQYRLDMGNGTITDWTPGTFRTRTWTIAGAYEVLVQARCGEHPEVESLWSGAITLTISDPEEIIQAPLFATSSPTLGGVGDELEFEIRQVYSNLQHSLEVQFDWGDGSFGDWVPVNAGTSIDSHSWSTAGTYQVKAMGRCIEHPAMVSDWTTYTDLEIRGVEVLTPATLNPADEQTVEVNAWSNFSLSGASSNMGHDLEFMFEYGDGRESLWEQYSIFASEYIRYSALGDYEVRARVRCIEHPDLITDWTAPSIVHVAVLEHVSTPILSGPATGTGTVDVPVEFTVSGAESTMGHDLEYQMSYGGDYNLVTLNPQGWTTADNLSIAWDTASSSIFVIVTARCIEHPEIFARSSYIFLRILE